MNTAGSISIAGVAVLESPRAVDPQKGPRHVVFDAHFCIVQGSETITMSLLRYFASSEMATEIQKMADKPFQKAFVIANVCISRHHLSEKKKNSLHHIRSVPPLLIASQLLYSHLAISFLIMHSSETYIK